MYNGIICGHTEAILKAKDAYTIQVGGDICDVCEECFCKIKSLADCDVVESMKNPLSSYVFMGSFDMLKAEIA